MFPTGNVVDTLEVPGIGTLQATLINAGIPTIFVDAQAVGYTGSELQDDINGDPKALAIFETLRAHGALRMGLIADIAEAAKRQHTPKVAFVAPPAAYTASSGKAGRGRRYRPARARPVHGQAAPRDDGHRRGRDRHGGRRARHAGKPCRRRRRTRIRAFRPPFGYAAGRRPGSPGGRPVEGHQGRHEPQRPRTDGRPYPRTGRNALTTGRRRMSHATIPFNQRPAWDPALADIVDYVLDYEVQGNLAYETARNCLIDTLGCGMEALEYPACRKLLRPIVPGTVVPHGAKVLGTQFQLDPVQAAFNIGAMIRWLDFNDTWLAAEWGHPSDNLGGILATADWLSRNAVANGKPPLAMRDVLTAMIKAHEIQGCIALENSFNKVGLDHVVLVKVASTAVVARMLACRARKSSTRCRWPGSTDRACAPTATRPTPAAARAGRGRRHQPRRAPGAHRPTGEMGYPSALTAPTWVSTTSCSRAGRSSSSGPTAAT